MIIPTYIEKSPGPARWLSGQGCFHPSRNSHSKGELGLTSQPLTGVLCTHTIKFYTKDRGCRLGRCELLLCSEMVLPGGRPEPRRRGDVAADAPTSTDTSKMPLLPVSFSPLYNQGRTEAANMDTKGVRARVTSVTWGRQDQCVRNCVWGSQESDRTASSVLAVG